MRFQKFLLIVAGTVVSVVWYFADPADAEAVSYDLEPRMVASGVYVFLGKQEAFSRENGANIVNTGFIIGEDFILVVDAGPTHLYAKEMISAIRKISPLPIRFAVITHHHGDHSFGIQAFKKVNTNVLMHPNAKELLAQEGITLFGFLETQIGLDWTAGTQIDMPTSLIKTQRVINLGQRPIIIEPYQMGHTSGDLVVYDVTTRTLFAGDLVFNERAATIPHAHIPTWLDHLESLENQQWDRLVPGHGPLLSKGQALDSTRNYLEFLQLTANDAVSRGTTLAEIMATNIPSPFDKLATVNSEFLRSMTTLFRQLEDQQFNTSAPNN